MLLQNYAQDEFPIFYSIFVHLGSVQDGFSLIKGGKFFTDPWRNQSAGQLVSNTVNKQAGTSCCVSKLVPINRKTAQE